MRKAKHRMEDPFWGAPKHHEELVRGLYSQLNIIFKKSNQGIYLYLDDDHKVCNKKFATLLNYNSPEEWANEAKSFSALFADKKSQRTVVSAYYNAMEKLTGSTIPVIWKKKNKRIARTTVIVVPIPYKEHIFALHFVSRTLNGKRGMG